MRPAHDTAPRSRWLSRLTALAVGAVVVALGQEWIAARLAPAPPTPPTVDAVRERLDRVTSAWAMARTSRAAHLVARLDRALESCDRHSRASSPHRASTCLDDFVRTGLYGREP